MASTPGQPLRFALAHEWAHLRRGDLWTWRLTRFALLTLWFQPAYWWLRWQVRLCQDYLADDEASRLDRRSDFAAFLVQSARAQQAMLAGAALPLSSRRSDLARRIAMLLNRRAPLESRCPRSFQSAAALVVVLLLTGAAIIRIEAQDTALPKGRDAESTMAAAENGITYGGRVITYGTETPIAGAEVVVRRFLAGDPLFAEVAILETTEHSTDGDGRLRVPIATPGEGGFWFLPPDAAPLGVVAPAGQGTIGNVQLEPGLRTRGRLLDADGRPVPGVRVVASRLDSESPELDEFKRLTFPLGGFSVFGFLREPTEGWFHTWSDGTESGLDTARVPKGLQQVWIQFSSESHRSLRVRRSPAVEPERSHKIRLDRLDSD